MRFQTTPNTSSGFKQSRQCQVAGKHRALQPEQATSSQQDETLLSPMTQGSIAKQQNLPNKSPAFSTICQLLLIPKLCP